MNLIRTTNVYRDTIFRGVVYEKWMNRGSHSVPEKESDIKYINNLYNTIRNCEEEITLR
jgi:hypothetical protein